MSPGGHEESLRPSNNFGVDDSDGVFGLCKVQGFTIPGTLTPRDSSGSLDFERHFLRLRIFWNFLGHLTTIDPYSSLKIKGEGKSKNNASHQGRVSGGFLVHP